MPANRLGICERIRAGPGFEKRQLPKVQGWTKLRPCRRAAVVVRDPAQGLSRRVRISTRRTTESLILHCHRRFLPHVTALALTGFGVGRDDVAFTLARILALAIVRGGLARTLPLARISTQALDLGSLGRRAWRVRSIQPATGECQCDRR